MGLPYTTNFVFIVNGDGYSLYRTPIFLLFILHLNTLKNTIMKELQKYQEDNKQIILTNPFNGRKTIIEMWSNPLGQYTVRAGTHSEYSYTGFIPNVGNMELFEERLHLKHLNKEIFK